MAFTASSSTETPLATSLETQSQLCKLLRHWILESTTRAGSGHATSSLSAVELMTSLFFGGTLRYDVENPENPLNDRAIFSKGHASPLLYGLWAAAGQVDEAALAHYREFGSSLEGHPTDRFRFAEAATGSLGQGLSIGLGMALAARAATGGTANSPPRACVLLGDSEMTEGSQWEAVQIAAHYELDNLLGVLDVNRLGQRGPTMYGRHLDAYQQRLEAFGWRTVVVEDGHDLERLAEAYREAVQPAGKPTMLIAGTVKGKGVSLLADQEGWHGKALDEEQLQQALEELGEVDPSLRGSIPRPEAPAGDVSGEPSPPAQNFAAIDSYALGDEVATRDGYGTALVRVGEAMPEIVALDGEVCNSTRAKTFREAFPDRFYEMFVAEQNMVGVATGLALRGKVPFVSTFAAFFSRAFDQIRMTPHSGASVKFVGSHAGVAIGEDGPSQMGLEDLAMFRSLPDSTVVYPCDAVSTEKLVEQLAQQSPGTAYLRTTRGKTPVIYQPDVNFPIGGSHVLRRSDQDRLTIVAAGVTLHEALAAHEQLQQAGIATRVIDLYSIKPIDRPTLLTAAQETGCLLTVEDHYAAGGIGEAVLHALADQPVPLYSLCVEKKPRSGPPQQLLDDHGISAAAIVAKAKEITRED